MNAQSTEHAVVLNGATASFKPYHHLLAVLVVHRAGRLTEKVGQRRVLNVKPITSDVHPHEFEVRGDSSVSD